MDFISRILKESRRTIKESDEASKNLAVKALKQVSETLDLLKSNVDMAISKSEVITELDGAKIKLQGIQSIVDAQITEVAEIIADLTGISTEDTEFDNGYEEDEQLEEDVKMTSDDALKNVDKVKKLAQSDVNVVIDDNEDSHGI